MKVNRIHYILIFFLLIRFPNLFAQTSTARFLLWPLSAKYTAMGGTGVSYCDDAFANFYNPAGIAFAKYSATATFVQPYRFFPNTAQLYQSFSYNIKNIVSISSSLLEYLVTRQLVTLEDSPDPVGEDINNPFHYEVKISAAVLIKKKFAIGLSISRLMIQLSERGAGTESGNGKTGTVLFGFGVMARDLFTSLSYQPEVSTNHWIAKLSANQKRHAGFSFGTSFTNAGPNISYIDAAQSDPPPTVRSFGFSYWPLSSDMYSIMMSGELEKQIFEASDFDYLHVGGELVLMRILSIRGGYYKDTYGTETSFATFGFGINIKYFSLNVARYQKTLLPTWHFDLIFQRSYK